MGIFHHTALLQAACDYLDVQPQRLYVDCTFGGGGHTAEILRRGGRVLAIDQDQDAIACGQFLRSQCLEDKLILVHSNFIHLTAILNRHSWTPVSGILIDLGVSLHQIQAGERGFSFQSSGPLDMRMDKSLPVTAADVIARLPVTDLTKLLKDYGEVVHATLIARKIVAARPQTTLELAQILPHPKLKRQVFQALRIAVNDELGALRAVLPQATENLRPNGRLVIISFHSLEDRLVKDFFRDQSQRRLGKILTPKPVTPSPGEIAQNPPSHSAKLRVLQKTK